MHGRSKFRFRTEKNSSVFHRIILISFLFFLSILTKEARGEPFFCETAEQCRVRLLSEAAAIQDEEPHEIYLRSRNSILEGSVLKVFFGNQLVYSNDLISETEENGEILRLYRFRIQKREDTETKGTSGEVHSSLMDHQAWFRGDRVPVTIAGEEHWFSCIDEAFSDEITGKTGALFLCEDFLMSGAFGASNIYKTSDVHAFLESLSTEEMEPVFTGISGSYRGATETGSRERTEGTGLTSYPGVYERDFSRLFLLSVDEALRYKEELWKFYGSSEENPEEVRKGGSTEYWLRTPYAASEGNAMTDLIYCVDLVNGNIRPVSVFQTEEELPGIKRKRVCGIRPCFVLTESEEE